MDDLKRFSSKIILKTPISLSLSNNAGGDITLSIEDGNYQILDYNSNYKVKIVSKKIILPIPTTISGYNCKFLLNVTFDDSSSGKVGNINYNLIGNFNNIENQRVESFINYYNFTNGSKSPDFFMNVPFFVPQDNKNIAINNLDLGFRYYDINGGTDSRFSFKVNSVVIEVEFY